MTKRIASLVIESIIILAIGALIAIGMTGGFTLFVGTLKIASVHKVRNPSLILLGAFLLRWWLAGHPLYHWQSGKTLQHLLSPAVEHLARYFKAKGISAFAGKLLVFLLLNGLLVNILLSGFRDGTLNGFPIVRDINVGWYCTKFAIFSPTHDRLDSWYYLYTAATYLHEPHEKTLYSELYFTRLMKFQYPPMSVLLAEPFRFLSQDQFIRLANFLSWISIFVFSVILARIFSLSLRRHKHIPSESTFEKIAHVILAFGFTVTFYPFTWSFRLGQIQTWIALFFILAIWSWMAGKKGLSGVFIGLICIIKPQLGLLAIWGLLRKQWRFTIGIIVTVGGLSLISLYLYGWANHVEYLEFLSYMSKYGESYYPNQSVNGLMQRLLFNGTNITPDIGEYPPYNPWVYGATLISSLLLIAAALLWRYRQHQHAELLDFSIAALSFTMASPIAWIHHYNIMLPMFAIVLSVVLTSHMKSTAIRNLLILSFMLCSNLYFVTNYLVATRFNVLQSLCFLGALLFLALLYTLRHWQYNSIMEGQHL